VITPDKMRKSLQAAEFCFTYQYSQINVAEYTSI